MPTDPFVYVLAALGFIAAAWALSLPVARRAKGRRRAALSLAVGVLAGLYVLGVLVLNGATS